MKATVEWDADAYQLGQVAKLTIAVTNDTKHTILIRGTHVDFRNTNKKCNEIHSIRFDPGQEDSIRTLSLTMGLWAEKAGATGSLRIIYEVEKDNQWSGQLSHHDLSIPALTITDASPNGIKIFISHSNRPEDKSLVEEIVRVAKKFGYGPYVSEKDSRPGRNLWDKILRQILDCDWFIVLFTKNGAQSCDMREELGYAQMRNAVPDASAQIKIIPLVEKGVEVTGSLKGMEYHDMDHSKSRLVASRVADIIIDSFEKERDET